MSVTNRNSSPSPYLKLCQYIRFPLILISFSVCTSGFCDYATNDCEQSEPVPGNTDICNTTRLCTPFPCQDTPFKKPEETLDEECQNDMREQGIEDWKSYKCCSRGSTGKGRGFDKF